MTDSQQDQLAGRRLRLGVHIVGLIMSGEDDRDPESAYRPLLEAALAHAWQELGPPPLSKEEHLQLSAGLATRADDDRRRDDLQALELYRQATTHACWAGAMEAAKRCYRKYVRLRTLVEQM